MSHSLIIGTTGSGKTTLAKHLAEMCRKQGRKLIVFSAFNEIKCDKWYGKEKGDEFLRDCHNWRNVDIFIDECLMTLKHEDDYDFLATAGRHYGFRCFFMAQRLNNVTPNIRGNCEAFYIFKISPGDAKEMNEITCGYSRGCENLKRYHYFEILNTFDGRKEKVVKKMA